MKTILIYENDKVCEYEINYDQDYMTACLKDYQKTHSLLRSGSFLLDSSVPPKHLSRYAGCIDSFVYFDVESDIDEDLVKYTYVAAINPTVYNILCDGKEFALDSKRIHALFSWYLAIKDNPLDGERNISLPAFDYYNIDDKANLCGNISRLLEDVSLSYVGEVDTDDSMAIVDARRNAMFVEEFGIKKENVKIKKK